MNLSWLNYFANPLYLLAIPASLLTLLLIYRRKGLNKKVFVATTLLLKALASKTEAKNKFKPPLRLLLELLFLALIILALANFNYPFGNQNIAIVIDNSFHTFAKVGKVSRLDLIKDQVQAVVSSLPLGSNLKIYSAFPDIKLLKDTNLLAKNVTSSVTTVTSSYNEADFQEQLEKIKQKEFFDAIYLITDLPVSTSLTNKQIKISSVHETLNTIQNNLAITSAKWTSSKARAEKISATIKSFSESGAEGKIALRCKLGTSQFNEIASKSFSVPSYKSVTKNFELTESYNACEVKLVFPANSKADLLSEDNSYWLVNNSKASRNWLVSNLSLEESKLNKLVEYNFIQKTPEEFEDLLVKNPSIKTLKDINLVVFHKYYPGKFLPINQLLILPPLKNELFNGRIENSAQISYWNSKSKLLTYLNREDLLLQSAVGYRSPLTPGEIIKVNSRSLLAVGLHENKRIILSGMELLPFTGEQSTFSSILLLNLLKWLNNHDTPKTLKVYEKFLNNSLEVTYLAPKIESLSGKELALNIPGIIMSSATSELQAVNFVAHGESNINQLTALTLADTTTSSKSNANNSFWNYLILVALIILVFDFSWIYLRKLV